MPEPTTANCIIYAISAIAIAFALFALGINVFPSESRPKEYVRYDSYQAHIKCDANRSRYGYSKKGFKR